MGWMDQTESKKGKLANVIRWKQICKCMTGGFGKEGWDNVLYSSSVAKNTDYSPQNICACLIGKMGFEQNWRLKICSLVAHLSYLEISSCWIWNDSFFLFFSFFFCIAPLSVVEQDWELYSNYKLWVHSWTRAPPVIPLNSSRKPGSMFKSTGREAWTGSVTPHRL